MLGSLCHRARQRVISGAGTPAQHPPFFIVEALLALARQAGVQFVFDPAVNRIEVDGSRATCDPTLPDNPSLYVHAPSRLDPAMASATS